jgi:hypothetical protein
VNPGTVASRVNANHALRSFSQMGTWPHLRSYAVDLARPEHLCTPLARCDGQLQAWVSLVLAETNRTLPTTLKRVSL